MDFVAVVDQVIALLRQRGRMSNRATTSFTLVGHSADFTPTVVQLAFWGDRPLKGLAQLGDRRGLATSLNTLVLL